MLGAAGVTPEETIKVPGAAGSITFPRRNLRHPQMTPQDVGEAHVATTRVGIQSY